AQKDTPVARRLERHSRLHLQPAATCRVDDLDAERSYSITNQAVALEIAEIVPDFDFKLLGRVDTPIVLRKEPTLFIKVTPPLSPWIGKPVSVTPHEVDPAKT